MYPVRNKVEKFIAREGTIRTSEFEKAGIPRRLISRLVHEGHLIQNARGVYTSVSAPASEFASFAVVSKIAPVAVICLLSALRFYDLTTENPTEIWVALPPNSRTPKIKFPPLRSVRFSGASLRHGIENHVIDGVSIRIYSAAKTVADCFKFRNKLGKDVAIEALHDVWKNKQATTDELWSAAVACRVSNVMRPYLESIFR